MPTQSALYTFLVFFLQISHCVLGLHCTALKHTRSLNITGSFLCLGPENKFINHHLLNVFGSNRGTCVVVGTICSKRSALFLIYMYDVLYPFIYKIKANIIYL